MSRVLVAYATKYGSTEEIAHQIASELQQAGIEAEAIPAKDVGPIDSCSAVIVGAALYNHKWHRDAVHFLSRNSKELAASSVAVFAVGPVNDDPEEFRSARKQTEKCSPSGTGSPLSRSRSLADVLIPRVSSSQAQRACWPRCP